MIALPRIAQLCASAVLVAQLHAQGSLSTAAFSGLQGSWTLDRSRSDSLPVLPPSFGRAVVVVRRDSIVGGQTVQGPKYPYTSARPGGAGLSDPRMEDLILEAHPSLNLQITISDGTTVLVEADSSSTSWRLDNKKRIEAQLEGGVMETRGRAAGKVMVLEHGIPGKAQLRKEFRLADDGAAFELTTVLANGWDRVMARYRYTQKVP